MASFYTLGIAPKFLDILKDLQFITPTPIQEQAIPIAIEGNDIIGIAQTGTGKTLAFGIPMIQRLARAGGKGLVVLPTRELALQVDEVFRTLGSTLGLRTSVLIGGAPMGRQLQELKKTPHVIIATPGRLLDHVEHRSVDLGAMTIVVLDEADRMLDMGFAPQIKKILAGLPKVRHMMLFSATMPQDIVQIATKHMKLPLRVEIAPAGTTAERVQQELFMVAKEDKIRLLDTLLNHYRGTVLIFSRTKHGAKKICRAVIAMGHPATELHSNRSLSQRKEALGGFKSGKYRIMVATDIAARGIDVEGIELVINFDIPDDPGDYVHRIGRTARAGREGKAISFVTPDQRGKLRDIERLTRMTLKISQSPELAPRRAPTVAARPQRQGRAHRPNQHGHPKPTFRSMEPSRQVRFGGRGNERRLDEERIGILQSPHESEDDKFFSRPRPSRPYRDPKRGHRGRGRSSR